MRGPPGYDPLNVPSSSTRSGRPPLRLAPLTRRDPISLALTAVIALAIPLVIVGNGVWLLLTPATIELQYALPGFPVDPDGVQDPHRTELAKLGVEAVRPGGEGVVVLQEARLPTGRAAFTPREVRHMADVRAVVAAVVVAWAVALVLAGLAAVALRARGASVRAALTRGGALAVAIAGFLALVMLVNFEWFFDAFHSVLFADGTWKFKDRFTLRQLYPDAFWAIAAGAVAVIALLQAVAITVLGRRRDEDSGPRAAGPGLGGADALHRGRVGAQEPL